MQARARDALFSEMSISSVRMFVHKAEYSLTLTVALSAIVGKPFSSF